MKWKFHIRTELKVAVALLGVCGLIAFSERKREEVIVKNIVIELDNVNENHFLDEADVQRLVESNNSHIIGAGTDKLHLRSMENKLKNDPHILDAELFTDLKGNLIANVELRRPVARVVRDDGPDAYIAEDGTVMGVSDKYTSRVVVISGSFMRTLTEVRNVTSIEEGKQLLEMIEFINEDSFWRSQVAQIDMNSRGEVVIFPQVTGQRIEFGAPTDVESKFRKLMIFYKEILPQRGWTKYERVNLKYAGQVIAE